MAPPPKSNLVTPEDLLWALIGLILTISGTFVQAFIADPPWAWNDGQISTQSLGVTYQVGAVLLIACIGGRNAGALSQIAYLTLGLSGFPIFDQGGGVSYFQQPAFGYLLGFIPGAWVCGWLAFLTPPRLESIAFCCFSGLVIIHLVGLCYLGIIHQLGFIGEMQVPMELAMVKFSSHTLLGHLGITCAVTVLAFILRLIMF